MRTQHLTIAVIMVLYMMQASCHCKDALPPAVKHPPTDRVDVPLKEIVVRSSPSPHYGFTYNDSGYVKSINFSSGLFTYNYYYKNNLIDSVTSNSTDARYLLYRYSAQLVKSVQQYDDTGLRLTVFIDYDRFDRVTKMEWKPTSAPPDEKIVEFEYYDNGNLKRMKSTYRASGISSVVDYEAYDNKRGVEGFGIFKDFMDHLVFLPRAKFQYNNPVRMKVVSGPNERIIRHEYVYRDSLPVERNSITQVTAGPSAGQQFTGHTTFTYY